MDFVKNAGYFSKLARDNAGSPAEFYFWFYAGRYYEKAGIYYRQSRSCFEAAMAAATSPEQKDNALWYLLNTSLTLVTYLYLCLLRKQVLYFLIQ